MLISSGLCRKMPAARDGDTTRATYLAYNGTKADGLRIISPIFASAYGSLIHGQRRYRERDSRFMMRHARLAAFDLRASAPMATPPDSVIWATRDGTALASPFRHMDYLRISALSADGSHTGRRSSTMALPGRPMPPRRENLIPPRFMLAPRRRDSMASWRGVLPARRRAHDFWLRARFDADVGVGTASLIAAGGRRLAGGWFRYI